MRHFTKTILAAVLLVLGVMNASAVKADLDPAMFKAWDGFGKDAKVVENPEDCPNSDGTTSPFGCDYKLYENVGAGACVFGNTNVYYLWYADITGTKTITIEGTAGLQLRFLFNRPAPEEGAEDPHGGQSTELNVTLDDNGQGQIDISSMEYAHLNTVKLGWGSPEGVIRKLELEGSVKPVTGWVDMINNGDMEGDDAGSFVLALDAVNDPGTYPATITDGVGRNGSRGIMVTSIDNPTETWATQFFIKMNELLPEGTQWRISMDIKADHDADCGSGCHEAPRDWKSGPMFDPNPHFTTDWQTFEASGTLGQIGDNGLGSIALDLNVDGTANNYYFDNISFQVFKESTPVSLIKTAYGADVVRVDFSKETNMKDLIKAAGGERVVYPNDLAAVTVNGQPTTLMSVEARPDGYLWIFIDEGYPEGEGEDVVAVSFTNPTDADKQLIFTSGKYQGEPVPSFSDVIAEYNFELSENFSYLYGAPAIVSADPEDGSFNLSQDMQEFKVTFDHSVDCAALNAKLDKEPLTKSPADGFAKEITLTRTGNGPLEKGVYQLTLTNVKGEKGFGETANYTLNLSFGPINIDPDDQPKDLIDPANFAQCTNGGIPAGFTVTFGEEVRTSESTYGQGPRMFDFGEGGDFTKGLYFREGNVEYGSTEGFELSLEAGKNYSIHFNSAMWKDNGTQMTFEVLDENDNAVISETIQNTPNVNGSYAAIVGSTSTDLKLVPETSGNYRLKWTSNGFVEVLLGNPGIRYIPNVQGVEEIQLVTNALENAKSVLATNSDSRYAGEAYNTLDKVIKEYDGVTFTAPSVCKKAAAELEAAVKAMNDHRTLCDAYDPLGDQAQTIIDEKAETKFAKSPIYDDLKAVRAKYQGKVLTDDAELKAAVDELKEQIDFANAMFTEGTSTTGMTGYAVLVERIRMGAQTLLTLGAAEDDPAIIAANDALSDDDGIANWLTGRIKLALYNDLKNGADSKLFEATYNESTLEEETPVYDLTAFVKNPNIYKLKASNSDYSQENVPGWTIVDGKGLTTGWSQVGSDKIPADAMVSNWGGAFTVYQTVENLPAGIYTLKMGFGERDTEESAVGSYIYAKTSANTTDSITVDCPVIGQSYPFKNVTIEGLVVTDGILTFGVQAGASSHVFFNDVQILLTAPATGFDYGKAYADAETGIDTTKDNNQYPITNNHWYSLDGRRLIGKPTTKGVYINGGRKILVK